jgi:hypothetical protein
MRKQYFLFLLIITVMISCSSTPKFSDVTGKKWQLVEVNVKNRNILFNRGTLTREGDGNIFTFNFDAQNINVTGAPSQCSGQYTLGNNQDIKLSLVNPPEPVPLKQPEKIWEGDFFVYMQNIYKWNLNKRKLELFSKTEDNAEVRMVFSQ